MPNFDATQHPRGKDGKFIPTSRVNAYRKLADKNVEHWTKSGSKNADKYKGLSKMQRDTVDAFGKINDSRVLNNISEDVNSGVSIKSLKGKYSDADLASYTRVNEYMSSVPKYNGHITRLMRDDRGVFDSYNVGDEMNFTRLTSFGKNGNDFSIRGGNLIMHIEHSTRGTSIENLMSEKGEREVLIDAGKYRVKDKRPGHIYLEEL